MGVKNLWDILDSCKKTLPLHHLQNKRVCIDLSCWIVQLHNVNKSHCSIKDKLYLKGLFHRIRALIALNCTIIFVTDGSIPGIKISTYRRRLHLENESNLDESSSNKVGSIQRNMGSGFSCMIKEAKILASALGVPCLDGIEEGEAQCALLDSESLCDGCFSSDSDIFLFGARTVYRDICLGEGGSVVCYKMDDIEKKLGFGRNSLIALAILLGCDYSPGVNGLGPESACQIVRSLGESSVLERIASDDLTVLKKANLAKKRNQVLGCNNKENIPPHESNINGHKSNDRRNYHFLQVMDAYLKPKCHSAGSQTVYRVLGMQPFQRTLLHHACARFFEWPPEKTDEYILPKIAERDLRRFANLRCTSSQLGVRLPLDMISAKCPVSRIIKRRKHQRKECFEVSWEEVDGLGSSIVPGELIESACPEKILEYEERIAEKKKPKPRSKKTETNKSLHEVDMKLQELVLEIEGEGKISCAENHKFLLKTEGCVQNRKYQLVDEPLPQVKTRSNSEEVKKPLQEVDMMKVQGKTCCAQGASATCEYQLNSEEVKTRREVVNLSTPLVKTKSTANVDTAIIDLLSPMCDDALKHDVIELSESETDVSPQHAKKARELRLFIASIRTD